MNISLNIFINTVTKTQYIFTYVLILYKVFFAYQNYTKSNNNCLQEKLNQIFSGFN